MALRQAVEKFNEILQADAERAERTLESALRHMSAKNPVEKVEADALEQRRQLEYKNLVDAFHEAAAQEKRPKWSPGPT